jgi:hypothetical protein
MTERTRAELLAELSLGGSSGRQVEHRFIKDLVDSTFTRNDTDIVSVGLVAAGVNATAAELNAAADISARLVSLTDANYTVLAANALKPHIIPDVTADRTITLPAPAIGLEYEFYAKISTADGHDWIFDTGSDTNYFVGGVIHFDTDADDAGDEIVNVFPDGNSNSILHVNVPEGGTRIKFVCDGTLWIVSGFVASATAPVFDDQAV